MPSAPITGGVKPNIRPSQTCGCLACMRAQEAGTSARNAAGMAHGPGTKRISVPARGTISKVMKENGGRSPRPKFLVLRLVDQRAGLDPGHHVAQLAADFLDRMLVGQATG